MCRQSVNTIDAQKVVTPPDFLYVISLLAVAARHCYNAAQSMADWKQITARIRRARTGKDPAGQLSNLYEKTRDAMVAFELARYFETSGQSAEAAKWYSAAAERFRRADWKTKAQEAAVRLGGQPPDSTDARQDDADARSDAASPIPPMSVPEPGLPFEQNAGVFEAIVLSDSDAAPAAKSSALEKSKDDARPRRRGRRGGRNRRKGTSSRETAAASPRSASAVAEESPAPRSVSERKPLDLPPLPVESVPDTGGVALRGRYGDPGLSSRLSLLEMQFRRLLTCTPVKVDEADRSPVGPGVFLLTDSDLTTYYYVEACQTLRIAIANLLRGGASRRGAESIKPQLADHLGIAESRVAKYLADHCVVRWLQLDEGASHFAHFVIAVLRPTLNE
jgi:hypothetical protein